MAADDKTGRTQDERNRREIGFDHPGLAPVLFGTFDENLLVLERRLELSISARGHRVVVTGRPDRVRLAEDVLRELHRRVVAGEEIGPALVEAQISMCSQPTLSGIVEQDAAIPSVSIRTRIRTVVPRSAAQARYMQALASTDLVFGLGPAGTGKTYVAVAQAVSQLISGTVQRLVLSRPAVEAGERLGFLPGDMKQKVDPYLRPLYDALNDCLPAEQVERRIASGEIEIAPIAFMRGRTLADAFVILDEAQNATPAQMKMFLTRFGERSRMVVCGDPNQSDLPGGPAASGLADAVSRLEGVEGIAIARFGAGDVVRHPLVGRVVRAYEGDG